MVSPNQLTVFRMIATPVGAVFLAWFPQHFGIVIALLVFVVAMATDAADGFIARKYKLKSDLGAFLDPLSDKILVLAYVILLQQHNVYPGWVVALTVVREIAVDAYRTFAYHRGTTLPARAAGKVKTVLQSISITVALIAVAVEYGQLPTFGIAASTLGQFAAVLLFIAFLIGLDVFRDLRRAKASVFVE